MADQIYKVGEAIDLGYQAPGKQSSLTIIAEIYLPNKAKDSSFPDVSLTEVGSSGTYRGEFTPDAEGTWQVVTSISPSGDGQVVRNYSVGGHNVHSVGEAVANVDADIVVVDGKIDSIATQVGNLDTPPMAF